jgi:hypothetical protein
VEGGAEGLPDVFTSLEHRGFTANRSLAGDYQPGTVLQIRDRGPDGQVEFLPTPIVFLWGDRCFPGEPPHRAAYVLEESSGTSSAELNVGADLLVQWLPQMALTSAAIAEYSLKLKPSLLAYAKGDLTEHFSAECVRSYKTALKKDSPDWFVVVVETVVSEGIEYEIRWAENTSGGIRTATIDQAKEKLEGAGAAHPNVANGPHLQVVDSEVNKTRLSSTGDIVLGYRTRALEPVKESERAMP